MDRDGIWQASDAERASLADLFASLSQAELAHPSLCAGWAVRDVAAHVALGPYVTLRQVVPAVVRARGGSDRMMRTRDSCGPMHNDLLRAGREPDRPRTSLVALVNGGRGRP